MGAPGGRLVAMLPAEPRTLNPVTAGDNPSRTVLDLLMGSLIRLDRRDQRAVPGIARSWETSPDGRRLRFELREGLRFSDGHPLDADDVLFTFRVLQDEAVASYHRAALEVGGQPVAVRKIDPHTLEVEMVSPYASGELLLSGIPVLPRHRLEEDYLQGKIREAWPLGAAPEEIVGLGPFRMAVHEPGQRLVLKRNPHYWKVDSEGQPLPYLDEVNLLFVADANARVLRFEAGESDVVERLSAASFDRLEAEGSRQIELRDLGPGLAYHFLFFNLNPLPEGADPEARRRRGWFRQLDFRKAVSSAIDREGIVRLVYRGRAAAIGSPVTPGNRRWRNPQLEPPPHSPGDALALLERSGFQRSARNSEPGPLQDPEGREIRFSLLVNAGNAEQTQMAAIAQEDLRRIGIDAEILALEFRTLVGRVLESRDYDACILALAIRDPDPNGVLDTWLSSGPNHFWHLGQESPATPWEAEIDGLLQAQLTALDLEERKRLFDSFQALAAEQLPFVFLVSPNILAGARRGLGNFRPAVLDPPTLWNTEELFWEPGAPGRR